MNQWEELRRQARKYENDLEQKLSEYNKLNTSGFRTASSHRDDRTPLLTSAEQCDAIASEIEQILASLTEINDKMAAFAQQSPISRDGVTLLHIIGRHREILTTYSIDYQKTKDTVTKNRQREELFYSRSQGSQNGVGRNRKGGDGLTRESQHLQNSHILIDEQLEQADELHRRLREQGSLYVTINARVRDVGKRFPALNSLMQRITLRKRRDTIIVAGVIAACIVLLILYGVS